MTTNINNSPKYACRTCMKQQCGCKDTESALPCHFYTEQPKQEPVGYFTYDGDYNIWEEVFSKDTYGAVPLYTHPVRTKDLTDDEIDQVRDKTWCFSNSLREFARAVITADREKNK